MNKIYKFMLVFAASAFLFAACDKPEPDPTPDPTPSEVCDQCGKNPCECENNEPEPAGPEWCTSLFEVNYTIDETAGYGFGEFSYAELKNAEGKTIYEYLGYATWEELAEAIGTYEEAVAFDRETQLFGIDLGSETDIIDSYNTNGFGYWVDANGVKDAWGTETVRCYTEAYGNEETGYLDPACAVGVMPGNTKEGDVYKFGMVFQRTGDEVLRAGVQVTIKVEAYIDPEAGQYPTAPTAGTHEIDFTGTLSLSANTYDYDGLTFTEEFEDVKSKLGLTTNQLYNTLDAGYVADDEGEIYTGIKLEGLLPDGTVIEGTNFWINADNAQTAWGAEDAAICVEWFSGATPDALYGHVCAMPSYYEEEDADPYWYYGDAVKAAIGKTLKVTYRITYVPSDDLGLATADPTVINMNYAITVAE